MNEHDLSHFFFAGGGTGGHIYPNLAVADAIRRLRQDASITFFCSRREVDARVLTPSGYEFLPLPAVGLSLSPRKFAQFFGHFFSSYEFAKQILQPVRDRAAVIGTGGFVTGPVVMAARKLKIPVFLINVDCTPGKANRFLGRFAERVFVQFEQSAEYFKKDRVVVAGCPLRGDFGQAGTREALVEKLRSEGLELDEHRKLLLVTGASSGARNINDAMIRLLTDLKPLSGDWQVVHLTGQADFARVQEAVGQESAWYRLIDYWDDMAALLGTADVVIGRAGAVSIAEFAAAGVPTVCLPYPYHKDRHQYENARALTEAGAAILVEDNIQDPAQTAIDLRTALTELMANDSRRKTMRQAAKRTGSTDAAQRIAKSILNL
ncbi:MAG: UDP-N-acetylglucosamine--N-acetylmuramyl-(pentapeptide) pyrophosphoryl-undecaprenol N-acetylglucosamine transferase [Planctomycetaceae bacterium]|nr:UDP-N-acetylglucosamine--N-acetylmuramyl-(pentapeptide) pyrophosphoryl-undecaprenol N-acetylglucosamine transferase [Planctomycetaceae bacterium]